ncbi:MAG: hypothetical protein ACE366_15495 [Bradymonadia bacterium]
MSTIRIALTALAVAGLCAPAFAAPPQKRAEKAPQAVQAKKGQKTGRLGTPGTQVLKGQKGNTLSAPGTQILKGKTRRDRPGAPIKP